MNGMISNHLSNRRMPTGRYLFAFKQILAEAKRRDDIDEVADWLEKCIEQGYKTLRTEFAYDQTRDDHSTARGNAVLLDNQLDSHIAAMQRLISARETGDDDDPVRKASRTVQDVIFPRGISAIIHQEFETQLGRMKIMIEQFRNDLVDEVSLLGIDREVALLERLVDKFETELQRASKPATTFDQVTAARSELHEYASMVQVMILAAYPGFDEATVRDRESLLAPFTDQQERVLEAQRRRRRVSDVDPETGEVVVDNDVVDDEVVEDVVVADADTNPEVTDG